MPSVFSIPLSLLPSTHKTLITYCNQKSASIAGHGTSVSKKVPSSGQEPSANDRSGFNSGQAESKGKSNKDSGPIEKWKQQPQREEPWTTTTGRGSGGSFGRLENFVRSHGEVIDDKKT